MIVKYKPYKKSFRTDAEKTNNTKITLMTD